MSNGTRWLSRFKKEKGEEVDSNFINYKLSLYNLNKTTLGLPILYINLYTGVALHLHPLKKITANTAPGSSSILDAIWRQMTCLSQQLFYGRWHDQYLYNYFKTKSEKIKRDGIITQKERKSQRKYPISILGYGRGASYPSFFIFSVMWINIFIRDLLFGLNTRFRWMWLHILCIHSFHFPI